MNKYVTDTQALVYFLQDKEVINPHINQIFLNTDKGENIIIIPPIVVMEIMYLFEKNRIPINLFAIEDIIKSQNYEYEPLTLEIIKIAMEIKDLPELHDRLIAATARYLDLPLITNDPEIINSKYINCV